MIDYMRIIEYYSNRVNLIEEDIINFNEMEVYLDWINVKDKLFLRFEDILYLKEYFLDDDFKYFGLGKLNEVRFLISDFINSCSFLNVNFSDYDGVVIDFYSGLDEYDKLLSFKKYKGIICRKRLINDKLIQDIESIKGCFINSRDLSASEIDDNLHILDNIYYFLTLLDGFS